MEKKKYISPKLNILVLEGYSVMDTFDLGSQYSGDAEAKRYKPIIIDDEEEEEWVQSTYLLGKTFLNAE